MDDEHMSPTITKRNPPSPLVTNSQPTVVNGPTTKEHLPADEDEMVTPLMPVSKMSESPSPKEAEEIAQEEPKAEGKPIKLSLSIEIPASALEAKRSDAYEAEKLRLREDKAAGTGKGKKCGESHIPRKHECTIGANGLKLTTEERKNLTESSKQHYAEKKKSTTKGEVATQKHTNPDGSRTSAYRARQFGSALARAGFTVGTAAAGVVAAKRGIAGKDDPLAAAYVTVGFGFMSLMGAKSLKREATVTKSTKDLVAQFDKFKSVDGVEPETIDQLTKFVSEAGMDVQRVPSVAGAIGINGYFDSAKPNRIHVGTNPSELTMSTTGGKRKLIKNGSDQEIVAQSVQTMVARRAEIYNSPDRIKLMRGYASTPDDLYELHSQGQYIGTGSARSLYTNTHEMAHAIHYRGDFATPRAVTVNGKVYSGRQLESELIKSSSYYGQADISRSAGKVNDYYDTGSRLETYAENYAMYVTAGKAMKKDFPVAYEWTKQTTDYALSKPVNKPARTFESVVEELAKKPERNYIDRMDAPMFSAGKKPETQKGPDAMTAERQARDKAKAKEAEAKKGEEPKLEGDELFMDLYIKVGDAAVKGDLKTQAELMAQAVEAKLPEEQMQILGDFTETGRMYEVIDGRAKPENEAKQAFTEAEEDEQEIKANAELGEEKKTDARRDAYLATRAAWT